MASNPREAVREKRVNLELAALKQAVRDLEQAPVRLTGTDVMTPALGVTLTECQAEVIGGRSIIVQIRLAGVDVSAGSNSVAVGTLAAGLWPAFYFAPIAGWIGGNGSVSGLASSGDGSLSIRYSSLAGTSQTVVLGGSWPLAL